MIKAQLVCRLSMFAVCATIGVTSIACAEEIKRTSATFPVTRVQKIVSPDLLPASDHPLVPAIQIAEQHLAYIRENVRDYTCTLAKRERIEGELRPYEYMSVKFRGPQKQGDQIVVPFSVYMRYLGPKSLKGREVLYVEGENDGDLLVRKGGRRIAFLDISVDPFGGLAMRDNRYPITEFGLENLVKRLIEVAQEDLNYPECEVNLYKGAKVDGRVCTAIEVKHPLPREHFRFHTARVFIDDELHVPIRYASYTWPESEEEEPVLLEEYTFRDLRLNVGVSNADFERSNPAYGFRKKGA